MDTGYRPDGDYGSYDFYQRTITRDARRSFARFFLGLIIFTVVTYAVALAIEAILIYAIGDQNTLAALYDNVYFNWIVGVCPMYICGLPVLYLIVRTMKTTPLRRSRIGGTEFLGLFAVAQFFMLIGSLIGNIVNAYISLIVGFDISNQTSDLIERSPTWLVILFAVIIGPIIEEFIFRKLMIDRLAKYGNILAIVTSAVAFALFHGNFYQFFYAGFLGLLLGYIYVKSGNWIYSVIMHMIINFFGSVVVTPVINASEALEIMMGAMSEGNAPNLNALVLAMSIVMAYSIYQYGSSIAGMIIFTKTVKGRRLAVRNDKTVNLPRNKFVAVALGNPSSIIYLVISLIIFVMSIVSSIPAA